MLPPNALTIRELMQAQRTASDTEEYNAALERKLTWVARTWAPYTPCASELRVFLANVLNLTPQTIISQPNDWVLISRIAQETWDAQNSDHRHYLCHPDKECYNSCK